jgi:asparagine synthase (glutamine-hydrolysing)
VTAIAGLWRFDESPPRPDLQRMLGAQQMYGPHATDSLDDGRLALGRALYRVLPEDRHDRQPMRGGDGTLLLVADIRLDNREELAASLGIGEDLARISDSAILLCALERWGDRCLDHLVGDYAFALFDRRAERWLLARDPTGQRPLHYHVGPRLFAFASMPKGLHALAEIPYAANVAALIDTLAFTFGDSTTTAFEQIIRLPPGHCATIDRDGVTVRRYWRPTRQALGLRTLDDHAAALNEHLDRAVAVRLRGVQDVASHLSAGLDSSSVTVSAAILQARCDRRVIAFTAAPQPDHVHENRRQLLDESSLAAATAACYGNINHRIIRAGRRSPLAELDRGFRLYDLPVVNPCNTVWLHAINDAAKAEGLTVLLTGAAGNWSLSYNGRHRLAELFRGGRWFRLARELRALRRKIGRRDLAFWTLDASLPAWVWRRAGIHLDPRVAARLSLLAPALLRERGRPGWPAIDPSHQGEQSIEDRVRGLERLDPGNHNKGVLGGWGIDQRDPTTDRRLIEFTLSVPLEMFLGGGATSLLARRALAPRVPSSLLAETRRGVQAADWHSGIAADMPRMREAVARMAGSRPTAGLLDYPRIEAMLDVWQHRDWSDLAASAPYRVGLLRGLSFAHFLNKAAGSNL